MNFTRQAQCGNSVEETTCSTEPLTRDIANICLNALDVKSATFCSKMISFHSNKSPPCIIKQRRQSFMTRRTVSKSHGDTNLMPASSAEQSSKRGVVSRTVESTARMVQEKIGNYFNCVEDNIQVQSIHNLATNSWGSVGTNEDESLDVLELSPEINSLKSKFKTLTELTMCKHRDTVRNKVSLSKSFNLDDCKSLYLPEKSNGNFRQEATLNRSFTIGSLQMPDLRIKTKLEQKVSLNSSLPLYSYKSEDPKESQPTLNVFSENHGTNNKNDKDYDTVINPIPLFSSVIAYVEVRTGNDNRSWGVKEHLRKLGATVVDRFTKAVTHVVFKEGTMATYQKALKLKVFLVSVLWIEECKKTNTIVPENLYPPQDLERYESPHLYPKFRKFKSIQPDFENNREEEYFKRKRKKVLPSHNFEVENKILDLLYPTKSNVIDDGSPGFLRAVKSVATIESGYEDYINRASSPTPSEEECPPPLAIRLLREYMSPLRTNSESVQVQSPQTPSRPQKDIDDKLTPKRLQRQLDTPSKKELENERNLQTALNSSENINISRDMSHKKNSTSPSENTNPVPPLFALLKGRFIAQSSSPGRRRSLRQEMLATKAETETATKKVPSSSKLIQANSNQVLKNTKIATKNEQKTMDVGSQSTQKRRKLMDISQPDDSPVLITPVIDDAISIRPKYPYTPPKSSRKFSRHSQSSSAMDLTSVVPTSNVIKINTSSGSRTITVNNMSISDKENCSRRRSSRLFFKERSQRDISFSCQTPTFVCTSLQSEDLQQINETIKGLGSFEVEEKVSFRTTHVVTKLPLRRTLNLLKGIARGCWLVDLDWVVQSQLRGKWLDEEKFELTQFSPAVQQYRLEKLSFGPAYKPDIFSAYGLIYICKNTKPAPKDLYELLTLCGGLITTSVKNADLLVGFPSKEIDKICVKELWVLDSITYGSNKNIQDYILQRSQQS